MYEKSGFGDPKYLSAIKEQTRAKAIRKRRYRNDKSLKFEDEKFRINYHDKRKHDWGTIFDDVSGVRW